MSKTKLAYARTAYKSFSQSARHILLLIATHQSIEKGGEVLVFHPSCAERPAQRDVEAQQPPTGGSLLLGRRRGWYKRPDKETG